MTANPYLLFLPMSSLLYPNHLNLGFCYEEEKLNRLMYRYFAAEIIGNLLGLAPRKWMRPKRMDYALNKERAKELGTKFQPYNWTVGLQTS